MRIRILAAGSALAASVFFTSILAALVPRDASAKARAWSRSWPAKGHLGMAGTCPASSRESARCVPAGGRAAVRRVSAGVGGATRVVATHSTAVRVCPMKVFQPDEHAHRLHQLGCSCSTASPRVAGESGASPAEMDPMVMVGTSGRSSGTHGCRAPMSRTSHALQEGFGDRPERIAGAARCGAADRDRGAP